MENSATPKGKKSRVRPFVLSAIVLLVLVIAVPPFVNINRFRRGIVQSISAGLGRPVYASSVELALFPRPAFILHHLTVAAEPPFGDEPVIMAETVTASLRASTLWHGRVEIASLHFDDPSVNLVRDDQGEWNFESLLRNSPVLRLSGGSSSAHPPPFPYVEATGARINFKRGAEKLPFSLESADLAVWKESGHAWHVRIKAHPVRTDLVAADTGQILGEAEVQTSAVLTNAPIHASLEWRRVQLGEISRLIHGEDRGWRGRVDWTANAQGTLAKLQVTTEVQVEEFRRAEFVPPAEMDLAVHCQAQMVYSDRRLNFLQCEAPLGGGHFLLQGDFGRRSPSGGSGRVADPVLPPRPSRAVPNSIQIKFQHISAGFAVELLRHIHPGVAADATASGEVNGDANCDWRGLDTLAGCTGEFSSTPLTLTLPHFDHSLRVSSLHVISSPLGISQVTGTIPLRAGSNRRKQKPAIPSTRFSRAVWNLAPVRVPFGGPTPATVAGTLTSIGPALNISGAVDLAMLNRLAYALNIPALSNGIQSIRGSGQMALSLDSTWLPQSPTDVNGIEDTGGGKLSNEPGPTVPAHWYASSQWSGRLAIHNATLHLGVLPGAIQIAAGQVKLTPERVEWTDLSGTFAHIPFEGSISWQTSCSASEPPCQRAFTLRTPNLNVEHLQETLRRRSADSGLLEQMNPWAGGSPELPEISGIFHADVLTAGKLSLKNALLHIKLQGHHADLLAISGAVFGGTLSGGQDTTLDPTASRTDRRIPREDAVESAGSANWGDGAPVYTLRATLRDIQPNLVAALWHQRWGKGAATAEIRLKTSGWSAAELTQNASGDFAIDWRNGTLTATPGSVSRISESSNATAILRFQRFQAHGTLRGQELKLESGSMVLSRPDFGGIEAASTTQFLSGTVTFSRVLDLRLRPSGISITGPLDSSIVQDEPAKLPVRAR